MKLNDIFPSDYLKASDLDFPIVDNIVKVTQDMLGDDLKLMVHLSNTKTLACNKTNAASIADIIGSDETDEWIGHPIELYATKTNFKGQMVPCIRVRPVTQPRANVEQVLGAQAQVSGTGSNAESMDFQGAFCPDCGTSRLNVAKMGHAPQCPKFGEASA